MRQVKVKICGIRSLAAARAAIDAGADFLGFNFVKSSKRYIRPEEAEKIIKELRIKNYELKKYVIARRSALKNDEAIPSIAGKSNGIASPFGKLRVRNDVAVVGVFQNQPIDEVNTIAEELNVDYVQLHGEEDKEYIKQMKRTVIKKINVKDCVILASEERARPGSELIFPAEGRKNNRDSGQARMTKQGILEFLMFDRKIQGQGDMVDLDFAAKIAKDNPIFLAGGLTPENIEQVVQKVRPFAIDVASGVETQGQHDLAKIKKFIYNAKNYEAI